MDSLVCISNKPLSPDEIRQIRKAMGMSQDRLGKELDLPTQTCASWEQWDKTNGKKKPRRTISQGNQIKLLDLYNSYLTLEWEQVELSA